MNSTTQTEGLEGSAPQVCKNTIHKSVYILRDHKGQERIFTEREKAFRILASTYAKGNYCLSAGYYKEYVDLYGKWVAGVYKETL